MRRHRGFTVIEILAVVAVLAIIAVLVSYPLSRYRDSASLQADTDNIVQLFREARSKTISSKDAMQYGVHLAAREAAIFSGGTYAPAAEIGRKYALSTSVEWGSISLVGGGNDVVFERLNGTTTDYGLVTMRVSSNPTMQRKLQIDASGLVRMQ